MGTTVSPRSARGNPTTLQLAVLKRTSNSTFVPVARWNSAYFIHCEICNASAEIDRERGKQLHTALQSGIQPGGLGALTAANSAASRVPGGVTSSQCGVI